MIEILCRSERFSNIQAVIFDKDGTLEDSSHYLYQLASKRARLVDAQIPGVGEPLLQAMGVMPGKIDPAGLMAVGSRLESVVAAAAYVAETGRGWIEAKNLVEQSFVEADRWVPNDAPGQMLPESRELLMAIHGTGCKVGILSNAPTADVEGFVAHHQLGDFLDLQMGADGEIVKPNPVLFWTACEQLGLPPERVLMIGDAASDILMAQRAGAAGCIGITWGEAAPHLAAADVLVDRLSEITINA
jgi:phosphoglycolate phosphatase